MSCGAALALLAALAGAPSLFGVALPLDPAEARRRGVSFPPDIAEVAELGARAVLIPITLWQADVASVEVEVRAPREALRVVGEEARRRGVAIVLMPLLELERGAAEDWRGVLRPRDPGRWWASYQRAIVQLAERAAELRAEVLIIGSELTSLSGPEHGERWRGVAAEARRRFGGRLAYVTNHDALDRTAPFEWVELAGVSAYFPLAADADASLESMRSAWARHLEALVRLRAAAGRPLVLFEVGYPSVDGGAVRPWDYLSGGVVDLEEQRAAYEAATAAIRSAEVIEGASSGRGRQQAAGGIVLTARVGNRRRRSYGASFGS